MQDNATQKVKESKSIIQINVKLYRWFYVFALIELLAIVMLVVFNNNIGAHNGEEIAGFCGILGLVNLLMLPVFFGKVLENQEELKNK